MGLDAWTVKPKDLRTDKGSVRLNHNTKEDTRKELGVQSDEHR
jgi:hypothetical protein